MVGEVGIVWEPALCSDSLFLIAVGLKCTHTSQGFFQGGWGGIFAPPEEAGHGHVIRLLIEIPDSEWRYSSHGTDITTGRSP